MGDPCRRCSIGRPRSSKDRAFLIGALPMLDADLHGRARGAEPLLAEELARQAARPPASANQSTGAGRRCSTSRSGRRRRSPSSGGDRPPRQVSIRLASIRREVGGRAERRPVAEAPPCSTSCSSTRRNRQKRCPRRSWRPQMAKYNAVHGAHARPSGADRPARLWTRSRRRRRSASLMARRSPQTGRSPRRRRRSAASIWSRRPTSTRRSATPAMIPRRAHGCIEVRPVWDYRPRGGGRAGGRGRRPDAGRRRDAPPTLPARGRPSVVDRLFREEQGRAVATLIRVPGDFDLAEEAVQDAFIAPSRRGRSAACRTTRAPGSRRRPGTGRSTGSAGGSGWSRRPRSWRARRRSRRSSRRSSRRPTEDAMGPSRTTDCG